MCIGAHTDALAYSHWSSSFFVGLPLPPLVQKLFTCLKFTMRWTCSAVFSALNLFLWEMPFPTVQKGRSFTCAHSRATPSWKGLVLRLGNAGAVFSWVPCCSDDQKWGVLGLVGRACLRDTLSPPGRRAGHRDGHSPNVVTWPMDPVVPGVRNSTPGVFSPWVNKFTLNKK